MTPIYIVRQQIGDGDDFWPICVTLDKEKAEVCLAESTTHHGEYWIDVYDSDTGEEIEHGDLA